MEQSPKCPQNLRPIAVRFQEKPENLSFSNLISPVTVILYLALFVYFFLINILTVAVGASVMNIY
jgi:hypothetical protein